MNNQKESLIEKIISRQDPSGCWNVLGSDDPRSREWNYYVPTYSSTLWTMIFVAELRVDTLNKAFIKPLKIINNYFFDKINKIFTIGKSHFPIPCLNGNMLYLNNYFYSEKEKCNSVIEFFNEYQRFDDGDYKTPRGFPYYTNTSCYGKHTCYLGVVKLLKGLSYIDKQDRTKSAKELLNKCIAFILKHKVCYSSKDCNKYLLKNIDKLTFPSMYRTDFLEILWLLKREGIKEKEMNKAIELLKIKRSDDGNWIAESMIKNLVVSFGKRTNIDNYVTDRAKEVYEYYCK